MKKRKTILVVDPFISPTYLCRRFNEEGYEIVGLKTIKDIPAYFDYTTIPATLVESSGNIQQDIDALKKLPFRIMGGIYGVELSIHYADKIFTQLFPEASNNPNTSQLRYIKYPMLEAMRHTPYYIDQIELTDQSCSVNDLKRITDFLNQYPECIIKPSYGSAGVVGVQTIRKLSEYHDYCKENNFLLQNTHQLVLQQKIKIKQEFYIDVASYKNKHRITAIGRYQKKGLKYLYLEHLDNTPHQDKLTEIIDQVLTKLGVANGLSHIEIAYTEDHQYKLIEYNPRISGVHGYVNRMAKNSSGIDQIDAYLSLLHRTPIKKLHKKIHQRLIILHQSLDNFTHVQSFYHYTPLSSKKPSGQGTLTQAKGLLMLSSNNLTTIKKDTHQLLKRE